MKYEAPIEASELGVLLKISHDIQSVQGAVSAIQGAVEQTEDIQECFESVSQRLDQIRNLALLAAEHLRKRGKIHPEDR